MKTEEHRELIIFDNHKIPRKLRGKRLFVEIDDITENFQFASSDVYSNNNKIVAIETDDNKLPHHDGKNWTNMKNWDSCHEEVFLKKSEYILRTLK